MSFKDRRQKTYTQIKADPQAQFESCFGSLQSRLSQAEALADAAGRFGGGYVREKFNHTTFSHLDVYTGSVGEWSGWMFNLSICVNGMNREFGDTMGKSQHLNLDRDNSSMIMTEMHKDFDGGQDMYRDGPFGMNRKFLEVMCRITTREGNVIVRSTEFLVTVDFGPYIF